MPDDNDKNQDEETLSSDDKKKDERTFTQADLDRIVKERLGREQARYADYDVLKKAAEELSKLKDADLSEQEKLKKRIAEMEEAAADKDAQAKAVEMKTNEKLMRAEVRVLAATMNFIDPEEAWKLADLSEVAFNDDGTIKNVGEALKKLAKDKTHLIKTERGPGSPANDPKKGTLGDGPDPVLAAKYNIRLPTETGG